MELNKPNKPQLGRGLDKLLGQGPPSLVIAPPVIDAQHTDTAHPNPSSEPARKQGSNTRRTTDHSIKRFESAAKCMLKERWGLIKQLRRIEEALSLRRVVCSQDLTAVVEQNSRDAGPSATA
jgi:hypothetical protein